MAENTPREIKYGNDFFCELNKNAILPLKITYWDLWIAIILVELFENNLDEMKDNLRSKCKTSSYSKSKFYGLLNHVNLLNQKLSEEDLRISDILLETDADFLKKQRIKAVKKIVEAGFQNQEKSVWMIDTPKKLRNDQAMRGHWFLFPIDPIKYATGFAKLYKASGFYSKYQVSALQNKIEKFLAKNQAKASIPELCALYRACLTVMLEKMEMVDDSFGEIGYLYGEVFLKYFSLDSAKLEMTPEDFFSDLVELILWEDYGLTDYYQPEFFKSLTSTEIPLVHSILLQQKEELGALELDYQEKEAITMLKKLTQFKAG